MMLPVSKMSYRFILMLYLQIPSMHMAPLHLQRMQPNQQEVLMQPYQQEVLMQPYQQKVLMQPYQQENSMQLLQQQLAMQAIQQQLLQPIQQQISMQPTQQLSLQQQLLALQQLQVLEKMNIINPPIPLTLPQPMRLILLPMKDDTESKRVNENETENEDDVKHTNLENGYSDEDLDSIAVDAKTEGVEPSIENEPQRAILLMPNGRLSIGEFISSIPWLPFEVNVPDTIGWAYGGISSGIAGIISIIGQRLPFRLRPSQSSVESKGGSLKMLIKRLQEKNQNTVMPILVLPNGIMMPMKI